MKAPTNGCLATSGQGERKPMNSELWHACAGPLVALPPVGSLVVYFPQGHSEQVAASMRKRTDCIPSYPNLPSKLICMLQNVTLHADPETDEVYAQMTLQPVSKYDKEAVLASDIGLKQNRQPAEFFYKTLTASDTSTHGGFSVPRRAAEKIFPPLDFSMQPPAQELMARDLHDSAWTFRHIYRGQPKRHLLTTGWSVFVSTKRLFAGDSVLFIRDERSDLLLGLRRANRQLPGLSSSVISSDSMHIGILAAAAHASANNSPFTIFYNPRASPCEFVIPLAKYSKAMYAQVSLGMRFRMMFETEESGVRRHMGTVTGVSELDPVRWKGSQWRNLQVGWDESTAGERPTRVSIWDIEPVVTPFYICPPPFIRPKFPKQSGDEFDLENALKRGMPWMGDDYSMKDATNSVFPGLSLVQWMNMQQGNQVPATQAGMFPSMTSSTSLHNTINTDDPSKLLNFQNPVASAQNFQFNIANQQNQVGQFQQTPMTRSQQPPQQQLQQTQQQQQAPPLVHQTLVSSGTNKSPNEITQQAGMYSQVPQQQVVAIGRGNQSQQSIQAANMNSFNFSPIPLESKIQHQMEKQSNSLSQRHQQQPQMQLDQSQLLQQNTSSQRPSQQTQMRQLSQQSISEQQVQLQLLQKLQQQQRQQQQQQQQQHMQLHQQPQPQNQQPHTQNQQSQHEVYQQMLLKQQAYQHNLQPQQQLNGNGFLTPAFVTSQQYPPNQLQNTLRPLAANRAQSALTDGDAPSCSTSPSTNNCHSSTSNFPDRNRKAPTTFTGDTTTEFASNLIKDIKNTPDTLVPNQLKSKGNITDQFEGSSSATSYRLEAVSVQQSFFVPSLLDGDVQSNQRNNLPYAGNVNGLAADTLLSRGYDSSKDLQNLFCNYGNTPQDFEAELSTAINSQPFGVPDLSFKDGCASEVAMNDAGVLSGGIWANQAQRLRTYTKVQKRGSVGRSIDVTRYRGYDELKQDLAHMFGIEGQLDDPQRADWKLVYVDHENDILLVGDDPWEEFVGCVQSIKILSFAEVQQLSLDGDLGNVPVPTNQACSGTDSGNVLKVNYDNHSATSFNR